MSDQADTNEKRIIEVQSSSLMINVEREKNPILSQMVSSALVIANNSLGKYPIVKKYIEDYYDSKKSFATAIEAGGDFQHIRSLIVEYKASLTIHISKLNSVDEFENPELWRALGDAYSIINPKDALPWLLKTAKYSRISSDFKILSKFYSNEKSPCYDFEMAVYWMELAIGDNKLSEEAKMVNMMDLVDLYLSQNTNSVYRTKAKECLQNILPNSKRFKFYKRAQKLFKQLQKKSDVLAN